MSRDVAAFANIAAIASRFELPLVFVVVTVQAQQFPVAAIRWVVVVIVVTVMNGQLTKIGVCEFAAAATADPWIDLERLLAVALRARFGIAARVAHNPVELVGVGRFHLGDVRNQIQGYFTSAS